MAELRRCSRTIARSSANVRNPMCCASRWTVVCETLHLRAIPAALPKAIISGCSNISLATCSRPLGKTICRLAIRYFSSCSVAGGRWSLSCSMAPHLSKSRIPAISVALLPLLGGGRSSSVPRVRTDNACSAIGSHPLLSINRPLRVCRFASSWLRLPRVSALAIRQIRSAAATGGHCRSRR